MVVRPAIFFLTTTTQFYISLFLFYDFSDQEEKMLRYKVINEKNHAVDQNILHLFYGDLWESALDRIHHQVDGLLFTISHCGERYRVYRSIHTQ